MSVLSAFQAALGKGANRQSEKPSRLRPGSDPAVDISDPNTLSKLSGVHFPVATSANYNYGNGYDTSIQAGEDAPPFPRYEPDDETILYRLFRIKA